MRIAYFQTAFLGDLLLSTPTLRNLKRWQPNSEITVFCRMGLGAFMKNLPFVDKAVEVDKKDKRSRAEFEKLLPTMTFDYLFCPHESLRSARWVSKLKAGVRVGFANWWNPMYFDQRVRRPLGKHDVLRQMSLLATLDPVAAQNLESFSGSGNSDEDIPDWASMTLAKSFWQSTAIKDLTIPTKPYVCLAPGSVWNTKRWTSEGFAAVASYYHNHDFEIFFIGSPEEAPLCEELAKTTGGKSLAGKLGLWQVPQFLSRGALMISNDSGAQHLASLAGVPTVSIFGPTVLSLGYRPWQNRAKVIEEQDLSCRPCGKHGHIKCPIGTHACMKRVSSERVIQAGNALLEERSIHF